MPKIQKSGIYTNGYDQVYWAAGHDVTVADFETFHLAQATENPVELDYAAEAEANPNLAQARKDAAEHAAVQPTDDAFFAERMETAKRAAKAAPENKARASGGDEVKAQ